MGFPMPVSAIRFLLFVCLVSMTAFTQPRTMLQSAEAQAAWREDLHYLAEQMKERHPNLFWRVSEADFQEMVATLDAEIPYLTDAKIIVELTRIVGIADAHSHLTLFQPEVGFEIYPFRVYFFSDGLFITAADDPALVGAQVTAVNGHSIEAVYAAVAPLVTHDNRYGILNLAPSYLISPQVLQALGIIESVEQPNFALVRQGETVSFNPQPVPAGDLWWEEWFMANLPQSAVPLYLSQHIDRNFWFTLLEDSATLYIQYNYMTNRNPDGETIGTFARNLEAFVEANHFDRVVLDLRHNAGGNNGTYGVVLRLLANNERINQRGKFYTIIGRRTFSAAANFVIDLEQRTETIFVGEPMGDLPNMYGDPFPFRLPNSNITVAISSRFWEKSPGDLRDTVEPHITALLSSTDYFAQRDPALEAILSQAE